MTTSVTHLWRLLKWGRTLARHGALTGIELDPRTPPRVRMLCKVARFGARTPATPDYAAALVAIGPAAIKLGQALSTRPDLVGERAAENLSQLQDDLPPAPFPAIKQAIETSGYKTRKDVEGVIQALEGMQMKNSIGHPQGDKLIRKEDHAGIIDCYISRVENGRLEVKKKIPIWVTSSKIAA